MQFQTTKSTRQDLKKTYTNVRPRQQLDRDTATKPLSELVLKNVGQRQDVFNLIKNADSKGEIIKQEKRGQDVIYYSVCPQLVASLGRRLKDAFKKEVLDVKISWSKVNKEAKVFVEFV